MESRVFGTILSTLLWAVCLAGDPSLIESGKSGRVPVAQAAVIEELAVLFELSTTTVGFKPHRETRSYVFIRASNWVATLATNGVNEVLWRRSADEQISMEQVFPTERHVVEFTPGDLKALNQKPAWKHLRSIIDPAILETVLKPTGASSELEGYMVERFEGVANGASWEVDWSAGHLIPMRLQQTRSDRILTLTARALYPLRLAPWKLPDTDGFRRTDFSDLGDMPNDPAVRRLTKLGVSFHSHCLH